MSNLPHPGEQPPAPNDTQSPLAGGPQRPRTAPDRGYYGAGWAAPAQQDPYGRPAQPLPQVPVRQGPPQQDQLRPPVQPGYGSVPPTSRRAARQSAAGQFPPPASRRPRTPADPSRAFAPGADAASIPSAAIAVLGFAAVTLASGLVLLAGQAAALAGYSSDAGPLLRSYGRFWLTQPLPFAVGAFLALVFLSPVVRRSPLPVVLLRAVVAGAVGTVLTVLVGVLVAVTERHAGGTVLQDVLTTPVGDGMSYTAVLLATATVAWLWLGRPARRRPSRAPGLPGTTMPADAVPPATIPAQGPTAQAYGVQQQPYGTQQPQSYGAQQQPYGGQQQPNGAQPQQQSYGAQPQPYDAQQQQQQQQQPQPQPQQPQQPYVTQQQPYGVPQQDGVPPQWQPYGAQQSSGAQWQQPHPSGVPPVPQAPGAAQPTTAVPPVAPPPIPPMPPARSAAPDSDGDSDAERP